MQIGLKSREPPLLPPRLRAYIYVVRPFTVLPAFIIGFVGAWILHLSIMVAMLFGAMLVGLQGGGQALNQANKTEILIDTINGKTYRPTVSGVLSSVEVAILAYSMIFIAVVIGWILGVLIYVIAMALLAVLYSQRPFYLKRYFPLGLIVQAFARGMMPIMVIGIIAHVNTFPLALFMFIWVISLQNTKDFPDVEGDKKFGIHSLPSIAGTINAQIVMFLITVADYIYALEIGYWRLLVILPLDIMSILYVNRRSIRFENGPGWVLYYFSLALGTVIGLATI